MSKIKIENNPNIKCVALDFETKDVVDDKIEQTKKELNNNIITCEKKFNNKIKELNDGIDNQKQKLEKYIQLQEDIAILQRFCKNELKIDFVYGETDMHKLYSKLVKYVFKRVIKELKELIKYKVKDWCFEYSPDMTDISKWVSPEFQSIICKIEKSIYRICYY